MCGYVSVTICRRKGPVRGDLLVAGHRGVEYHLANRQTVRTDGDAAKYRPILEHEDGGRTR